MFHKSLLRIVSDCLWENQEPEKSSQSVPTCIVCMGPTPMELAREKLSWLGPSQEPVL